MSLLRLLTAGKCLTDLKDSTSRYRMRQKMQLPKFGSPKNPFAARRQAPAVPAAPAAPATTDVTPPVSPEMTPAELAAARLKKTMRLPALVSTGAAGRSSQPRPAATALQRVAQWANKLNPLSRWPDRPAAAAPRPVARAGRSPVQGELSLDKIKVVRNDLNDADVEVVPAKSPARTRSRAVALAETQPG
jgi:hypothetical protein